MIPFVKNSICIWFIEERGLLHYQRFKVRDVHFRNASNTIKNKYFILKWNDMVKIGIAWFRLYIERCRKLMIGDKINCIRMYHLKTECPRNLLRYVAVVLASWTWSFMQVDLSYDTINITILSKPRC